MTQNGCDYHRDCACKRKADVLRLVDPHFRGATFETFEPRNQKQRKSLETIQADPQGSFFVHGAYGQGKTHLLWAQFRVVWVAGIKCAFRTSHALLEELRKEEMDEDFSLLRDVESVHYPRYHLFLDDIEKVRATDFRREAWFRTIDTLYRKSRQLSITSNWSLKELGEKEILPPAAIRRLDDMATVIEL